MRCLLNLRGYSFLYIVHIPGQFRGARQVIGVDIDDTLIRSAWRRRRTVWSLQSPEGGNTSVDNHPPPKRQRLDCDTSTTEDRVHNYFPASCEHSYGPLPIPDRGCAAFPHNVMFRTADWVKDEIPEDDIQYDIILGYVPWQCSRPESYSVLIGFPSQNGFI